jgi:hypothetical protein
MVMPPEPGGRSAGHLRIGSGRRRAQVRRSASGQIRESLNQNGNCPSNGLDLHGGAVTEVEAVVLEAVLGAQGAPPLRAAGGGEAGRGYQPRRSANAPRATFNKRLRAGGGVVQEDTAAVDHRLVGRINVGFVPGATELEDGVAKGPDEAVEARRVVRRQRGVVH